MMQLSPYVHLYRAIGRPDLRGNVFNGSMTFDGKNVKLVQDLRHESEDAFRGLWVDGDDIDGNDTFPDHGNEIEFEVHFPGGTANRFHNTIADFLRNTPGLSKGEMPDDFYIVENDFYSKEDPYPIKIKTLASICLFIKRLSKLANYHALITSDDHLKLVFLRPNTTESSTPIEIITKFDESLLDCEPPDPCLINELCSNEISSDLHFVAKKGVFGVTLAEFMESHNAKQDGFSFLVRNWNGFIGLYHKNIETYISGFAFHKAKREVAETDLHLAGKFSSITSEITGKLLSIPVSLAVTIAVFKSNSLLESVLLIGGLLLAALIMSGSVKNQMKQLERIVRGKELLFNSFEGRKESFPVELNTAIKKMIDKATQDEQSLNRTLIAFRFIAWVPVIVAVMILFDRYNGYDLINKIPFFRI